MSRIAIARKIAASIVATVKTLTERGDAALIDNAWAPALQLANSIHSGYVTAVTAEGVEYLTSVNYRLIALSAPVAQAGTLGPRWSARTKTVDNSPSSVVARLLVKDHNFTAEQAAALVIEHADYVNDIERLGSFPHYVADRIAAAAKPRPMLADLFDGTRVECVSRHGVRLTLSYSETGINGVPVTLGEEIHEVYPLDGTFIVTGAEYRDDIDEDRPCVVGRWIYDGPDATEVYPVSSRGFRVRWVAL